MKTKLSFLSVVFCYTLLAITINSIHDHSFALQWSKTFGGSDGDVGNSVQQTNDGGFIIVGYTTSFGAGESDFYLIKTDASGNELWSKTFGGSDWDVGNSVQQTNDGGFIIVGSTGSFGDGNGEVYLIKTNASGNELWSKTFGGAGEDLGNSVQQTDDGGFIIVGSTGSFGDGNGEVYLIKTDASGNELWSKTFGGADEDLGNSVQQTDDGGYIIAGVEGFNRGIPGTSDVYLIKTDALGNELWSKTFGGADEDSGESVQQTNDGGFIITGDKGFDDWTDEGYVYLIKTDASGIELWSKTFGGANVDRGKSVQQTNDGGFIIAGYTCSFGAGDCNVYLIKTDASGNEIWSQTIGGTYFESGESVQQTDDGGYIIAGTTNSFGSGIFDLDVYLIYYKHKDLPKIGGPDDLPKLGGVFHLLLLDK